MIKNIFQKNTFRNLVLVICLVMVLGVALLPSTTQAIKLDDVREKADELKLAKYENFSDIFTAILKALLSLAFIVSVIGW